MAPRERLLRSSWIALSAPGRRAFLLSAVAPARGRARSRDFASSFCGERRRASMPRLRAGALAEDPHRVADDLVFVHELLEAKVPGDAAPQREVALAATLNGNGSRGRRAHINEAPRSRQVPGS